MRLIHLSDTHGRHKQLTDLPQADIIVHTGDITEDGTEEEVKDFVEWFGSLPCQHKIFIAGNHDLCLYGANIEGLPDNVHYLSNEAITIDGIKFYGVPMFLHDDLEGNLPELYSRIPEDTDVLLTHQAPLGILDDQDGINFGDYCLYKRVIEIKPKYHLFGHLHHTVKTRMTFRGVKFSNAAGGKYGRYELLKI
ncbi:MAG: metallophosphatase domain-containing protein [Bacteroidales bacterium]|nr:metallophosphatase domain-containing protein [Bacteroidales bacterium]